MFCVLPPVRGPEASFWTAVAAYVACYCLHSVVRGSAFPGAAGASRVLVAELSLITSTVYLVHIRPYWVPRRWGRGQGALQRLGYQTRCKPPTSHPRRLPRSLGTPRGFHFESYSNRSAMSGTWGVEGSLYARSHNDRRCLGFGRASGDIRHEIVNRVSDEHPGSCPRRERFRPSR